jgi:hypothetical protein
MTTHKELAQALVDSGFLSKKDVKKATAVLVENLDVADAEDTKKFATKDLAYQKRVIDHAEEMAEEDLSTLDFEDRFVQAEVIESAATLAEKDVWLIQQADEELLVAFNNASGALVTARLIKQSDLEAAAAAMSNVWEISEES